LDTVSAHVFIDAFDRRLVAFKESAPVFRVRREDLVLIAIDEGLKILSMCARIAAASDARSSSPVEAFATKATLTISTATASFLRVI
jgi:hypothetical protein